MPSIEEKEIILRSEEVNEILTSTPKWILRWGILVVFILIIITIGLSYFIKYPDVLTADVTLTTLNPPITLVSKNNGKLTHLLVKDKQLVSQNEPIGIIENTADYKAVLSLLANCNQLNEQLKLNDTLNNVLIKDSLRTGEITPYYLQFLKSVKDLNLYESINPYTKQIALLKKDLGHYNSLLDNYKHQQKINDEQLKLAENDFNRDKKLFEERAISAREFEIQKKNYLGAQNSNEQTKITISNALIQINGIEKNILQLQIQDYQEKAKLKNELSQYLKTLINEINKWKQLYVIESPVSGKVSFFNVWAINQNIKQGDELFAIIPNKKQQFIGKCVLPITNSGKLTIGQVVNIKLDNYPYNENGMLTGVVKNISEVPNKDSYAVDIVLANGLTTSYNKTLVYKEQMKGKADIITKNISVLDRVFFNFRKLTEIK
ncbi:MAG: HlyD family efflux transporter periplasmic adaptor subunit [Bacteroidia bacterium]|nr:HlyD family efflux transporter periplasmic adaptor subunit [Bacteroidia bacterium]